MQTSVSSKLLPKYPKTYLQSIGYWYVFSQKRSAGMLSRRLIEPWADTILFLRETVIWRRTN